jgi:amidase
MSPDLLTRPVRHLADLIRRRQLSPDELVSACLERIASVDGRFNSIVTVDADGALAAARRAREAAGSQGAPPFLGVPLAVKDLALTAGIRTTFGTASLADFVPDVDDEHVARLRRAGFIIIAKTNVPELGTLPITESRLLGPCRNPWDDQRTPGGSSGGAAAALAAGLVPAVQGSDGGGSLRIPASNCGLFGLKPARGRVSSAPLGPEMVSGLSSPGPLTRDVADAAAMLDVMCGYALGDPHWAPDPPRPYAVEVTREPPPLRCGLVTAWPFGTFDAEAITAAEDAARLLESLGHRVEPLTLQLDSSFKDAFQVVWAAGLSATPVPHDTLEPFNAGLAAIGRKLSAAALLRATAMLQVQARAVITATAGYDAVVSPTLTRAPLRIGELDHLAGDPSAMMETLAGYVGLTPLANVTGQPSMSLPLGIDRGGLPLGVMVTGRPADEATLLRLAAQLQAAVGWNNRRPPVAASTTKEQAAC